MTAHNGAKPDLSSWPTKQEASEQLGVSSKTVEKLEKAGKLQSARRPNKSGPALVVYHPDDVAREARSRQVEPKPFLISAAVSEVPEGLQKPPDGALGQLSQLLAGALREAFQKPQPRMFLTIAEASKETGLTQRYLKWAIERKILQVIRDGRRVRIRRRDLEGL